MIGLRPKTSALYLERPRLLRLLPEEAGYVVWLEAPYGYGKSVLISQWVERLEAEGWRVVWLGLVESNPREGLTRVLGLPENAPWTVVLEKLEDGQTVVVLEDLEMMSGEGLGPLIKHNPGLLLLASRRSLREPELLRARTEGRLIHLTANQLAFTSEEAAKLFGNTPGSAQAWERTKGWSLPLHLAALTGEVPEEEGLWQGVRESLEVGEWQEMLFLSVLDYLPQKAADERDQRLTSLGFVQALEQGYRLHSMAAEQIMASYPADVRQAVLQERHRLEPRPHGLALERVELWSELEQLLLKDPNLGEQIPLEVERWTRLLPENSDPSIRMMLEHQRAYALGKLGQGKESAQLFLEVADSPYTSPRESLLAYGEAVYELSKFNLEAARNILPKGDALLDQAAPEDAANYLNASAGVDYWASDIEAAARRYRRALELAPAGMLRTSCRYNLSLMQWWLDGDGAALLAERQQILADPTSGLSPAKRAFYCRNAGIKAAMTGFTEEARSLLQETIQHASVDPFSALQAECMLKLLEGDLEAMPALWSKLKAWNNPNAEDRILHKWLLTLLEAGKFEEARLRLSEDQGGSSSMTPTLHALVRWFAGHKEAPQTLPEPLDPVAERERCLLIRAARFRVLQDEAELDEFLKLTVERERPLSYYIPLSELPQHRPELARYYPLEKLLSSGWKEATQLRLDEIPPLEVDLLGKVEVRVLGQPIMLNPRPRDVLLLMVLGKPRSEIAEAVWPEVDPDKSRNNFHVTLNLLRKAIEPWGVSTHLFEAGLRHVRVDAWELQKLLERGDIPAVLKRYSPLAPGVDLPQVLEQREHLAGQVMMAVLGSVNAQNAEERLEWILHHDPLHEEAFERLLEVWVRSGRRVTAERRYREFAKRLREELGMEPAPQLQRMLM